MAKPASGQRFSMKWSNFFIEAWRFSTVFLTFSLFAMVIPLFISLFDASGTHTFTWDSDLTVGSCATNEDYKNGQQYSHMCKDENDLSPFMGSADGIAYDLTNMQDGVSQFDYSCSQFMQFNGAVPNTEDCQDQCTQNPPLSNTDYENCMQSCEDRNSNYADMAANAAKAKIEISQTLTHLCASFDSNDDSFINSKMCLELDGKSEDGGAVTQYLTTVHVGAWVFLALLGLFYIWQLYYFTHGQASTGNVIGFVLHQLTPHREKKNEDPLTKLRNWVVHGILMAGIHVYSVILAVFAAQSVSQYNNSDVGMNIDMVTKNADQTSNDDNDSDYKQRVGSCFSSVPGFFLWNIAQKSHDDEMKDAPPVTQAIFNLSIIVAVLSGICLFSYLYFKWVSYIVFKDDTLNMDTSWKKRMVQYMTDSSENENHWMNRPFTSYFRNINAQQNDPQRASVGSGIGQTHSQNGYFASADYNGVPSSVREEKNDGEMFDKSVQKGANLLSLQF